MNESLKAVQNEEHNIKELLGKIASSQAVEISPREVQWQEIIEDARNQAFDEVEDVIGYLMAQAESKSIDWESINAVRDIITEWKIGKGLI